MDEVFGGSLSPDFQLMYLCSNWVRTRAAGYVGDAVGVGGDVLEGGPALLSRGGLVNCV
jgi:hypothetical protein